MLQAATAVVAAFNLVCTGTSTWRSLGSNSSDPYTHTYRIDLDKKQWCEEGCGIIRDIADVQPVLIEFKPRRNVDNAIEHEFYEWSIDRTSGQEHLLWTKGRGADITIMKWEGTCIRQPFTGFPSIATKF